MALASVKGGEWWPSPPFMSSGAVASTGSVQLNVAGEIVALCFVAPFSGTISEVDFYVSAVGTSGDVDVRIETVNASTGDPSGTLAGTNTNLSMTISTTGAKTAALTAGASITRGSKYAIVFSRTSGDYTIACTNRAGTQAGWDAIGAYGRYHNGTAWQGRGMSTTWSNLLCVALKLNDGSYAWLGGGVAPFQSLTNVDFNNTSSDRERGIAVTMRAKKRAVGWFAVTNIASGDAKVILANTSGTALATYTGDKDEGSAYGLGSAIFCCGFFDTAVNLDAGTTYYLTVVPQSATNCRIVDGLIMDTAETAQMNTLSGGTDVILVTRNSGGTYSTDATKRPWSMGLIFDQSDDGAGGGGGGLAANPIRGFVA